MKELSITVFTAILLVFSTPSFGQGVLNENINTDLPPGVTMIVQDVNAGHDFGLAQDIYIDPEFVTAEIALGNRTTSLGVSVTSKEDVVVRVETTSQDLVVVGDPVIRIRAGARMTVALTAFLPHSGELVFFNMNNEELARVPYSITQDSGVRQNVSASFDFRGSISANYSANFPDGWSLGIGVGYSIEDSSFRGRVSGGYSW